MAEKEWHLEVSETEYEASKAKRNLIEKEFAIKPAKLKYL